MRGRATYLGPAGTELAKQRLSGYLRYATLVSEQEEALERGDLREFGKLAEAIDLLQSEIGVPQPRIDPPSGESPDTGTGARGTEAVDAKAVDVLRTTIGRSERIRGKLAAMKRSQANEIRSVTQRKPQARTYLLDDRSSSAVATKLDVRS